MFWRFNTAVHSIRTRRVLRIVFGVLLYEEASNESHDNDTKQAEHDAE